MQAQQKLQEALKEQKEYQDKYADCTEKIRQLELRIQDPVSYTHLDVYKRQVCGVIRENKKHGVHHMLIWMKTCLCKQACNTLSHLNQHMAELWRNKVVCKNPH